MPWRRKPARWLRYWEGPVKRDTGFKAVLVYCVGPAEPRSYHDCCRHDGRLGPPLATLCSHSRAIGRLKQAGRTCPAKAADGRDLIMHARIATLQALNRHMERVFNPERKEPHWVKRKLKRDQ
jgi:hypothetical protein